MIKSFFLFLALFLSLTVSAQYTIPPRPSSDASLLFDYTTTSVLSAQEKKQLNQELIAYEKKTSTQIAIVLVQSLQGEDPNALAAEWGHQWQIGQEGKDNGLVILLALDERKMAIQNGYGLEEYLTDVLTSRIIQRFFIPSLKKGNYYQALQDGFHAIVLVLQGKFIEDETSNEAETLVRWGFAAFFVLLLLIWIFGNKNSGGGQGNSGRRRRGLSDVILSDFGRTYHGGGGFGSGGGFGGSSGGFGGFGGGGFGGGGASGSW